MQQENTTSPGGLLIGETDKDGGTGIKVVAPEGNITMGGGEIIINEKSSKKYCQELSKINSEDGNGVVIPCSLQPVANTTDSKMEVGDVINKASMESGGITKDPYINLWNTYLKFVDGIDGIISEEGELSSAYWKEGVEDELNSITQSTKTREDIVKNKDRIISNAKDLLDGAEGVISTGRISQDRYFKKGAISSMEKLVNNFKGSMAVGGKLDWKDPIPLTIDYIGGKFESWYHLKGLRKPYLTSHEIDFITQPARRSRKFSYAVLTDSAKLFSGIESNKLDLRDEYAVGGKAENFEVPYWIYKGHNALGSGIFPDLESAKNKLQELRGSEYKSNPKQITIVRIPPDDIIKNDRYLIWEFEEKSMEAGGITKQEKEVLMQAKKIWTEKKEEALRELKNPNMTNEERNRYNGLLEEANQHLSSFENGSMEKGGGIGTDIFDEYYYHSELKKINDEYNPKMAELYVMTPAWDELNRQREEKVKELKNKVRKYYRSIDTDITFTGDGLSIRGWQYSLAKKMRKESGGEITESNPEDTISMDVPLFIRTLEYAKEDAKTDMDLHKATENAINLSKSEKTLTMKDYDAIVDVDNKEIQTCKCPTMTYHNRLTQEAKERLGERYIAEGTTIKDMKTGAVSDIVGIVHTGFNLLPQSNLDNSPRQEFFVPFEEIVDKHGRNLIEIGGYQNTEPDHKVLILAVKDIIACNIIKEKNNAIDDMSNLIDDQKSAMQDQAKALGEEALEDVELTPEMAHGGIIGEVKASRNGVVKEVRDTDGKMLDEVYAGDLLYRRSNGKYRNSDSGTLLKYDVAKIHMAYGGIVGVEEKPNYYYVDIASPKKKTTCKTPAYAANIAESIKSGAKATTCKAHGKWFLSSILVPKDGITSNEAKHIASEIRDKIQHRNMAVGGFIYETGASSEKVNNLILFADTTRSLVEMRDAIYETIKNRMAKGATPTKEDLKKRFEMFLMKTKLEYLRERGYDKDSKEEVRLTSEEDQEFLGIYAEDAWINSSGTKMEEDADKMAAKKYWNDLNKKQKLHFLLDHADYVFDKPASKLDKKVLTDYKKLSSDSWNKLPKEVQMAIEEHVIQGVYATGGEISGYTPVDEEQSNDLIGDDVKSTVDTLLVLIDCTEDPEEKENLRNQLKQYGHNAN